MSVNILDLAKSYLSQSTVDQFAGLLGENSSGVESAFKSILPSVLGAVMQKASTTSGAGEILDIARNNSHDGILDNLSGLLGNSGQFDNILSIGSKLLPTLFGNKTADLTSAISSKSGIQSSSVTSLLSFAAPFIMSILGKQVNSSGMGLSGLTSLLMGQKDSVLSALPSGLGSVLNFADLGDFKGSSAGAHQSPHSSHVPEDNNSGSPKWLLWLVLGLVALGLIWGLKTCKKDETTAVTDEVSATVDSAGAAVSDMADSAASKVDAGLEALGAFFKRKLPNGIELDIPELGIENKLVTFIEDASKPVDKTTWFNFDRINFETGSANLDAESKVQIKNMAEILKAFPKVNLKVGGYTDNTGNDAANLKLSQDRANSVKAAIVAEGIEAKRLDAEGYGKEHPVASNDTEEGRAQNRRIAVRVTAK